MINQDSLRQAFAKLLELSKLPEPEIQCFHCNKTYLRHECLLLRTNGPTGSDVAAYFCGECACNGAHLPKETREAIQKTKGVTDP